MLSCLSLWSWYTVDSVLCALVGFLHGLCDARLPDTYTWLGCGIRPHVLSTQKVLDPFSPFLLALPPTLPPMWSTSSPEGGRDVVHGNLIPAGQRTGLLQCSRCEQPLHTHASCAVVALCRLQEDSVVHVLCANDCQSVRCTLCNTNTQVPGLVQLRCVAAQVWRSQHELLGPPMAAALPMWLIVGPQGASSVEGCTLTQYL